MAVYHAGADLVELVTPDEETVGFLDSFLDRAAGSPFATITVTDEVLGEPPGAVTHGTVSLHRDGSHYRVGRRSAAVPLDRGEEWGVLRKLVRESWLARQAPRGGYYFLHASAVDDGRTVIVFTGDKRGGKTTLMLDAVARHGCSLLTNDGLLFYRSAGELTMSPLPTLAKIRDDVVDRFWPFLSGRPLDPFNAGQLASWESARRTGTTEGSLFLTFGALGRKFAAVPVAEREIVVVGVRFGTGGQPARLTPLAPPAARVLLARNSKPLVPAFADVVGLSPASEETARQVVAELAERVTAVEFTHTGEVAPVVHHRETVRP